MTKVRRLSAIYFVSVAVWSGRAFGQAAVDPLTLANPLVGTALYGGAMYPGAALPYGMVKVSPDTTKPSTAGYNPTSPILGFSHTHIGGIGGAAFGGQIRVRPQTGPLTPNAPASPKANETASPGYYAVNLTDVDVRAELTATARAGVHRYTFPPDRPARVLIDFSALINNQTAGNPSGVCKAASGRFAGDREIEGQATLVAGNGRMKYTIYCVGVFDQPATGHGAWVGATARVGAGDFTSGDGEVGGLYAEFPAGAVVNLRVGISYDSLKAARANVDATADLGFDQIRSRAEGIWRTHFEKISIEGGTDVERRQFYTALYHTVLAPTDVTGDNGDGVPDSTQPYYWDFYTLWDTFRTTHPLTTLIDPQREQSIIRGMLAIYQREKWLPDAWVYNKVGLGFQGGTHADNVIADAVVKRLGGFDLKLAYEAIHKNATVPGVGSKRYPNAGRLEPYFKLGYVPSNVYAGKDAAGQPNEYSSGASRTLEYAYNDFAVAQVADAVGEHVEADRLRTRSLGAYVLFDTSRKMFWGKNAAGEWNADVDPTKVVLGWTSAFYEGSAWQYRFSMPHDVQGLINRYGGDAAFVAVLDEYFDRNLHGAGNEPGFLTPYLYTYAGRPDKTADRLRTILAKDFKLAPGGYPGDEDVGAMSAWYLFSAMGFFPNAGQDVYLIGAPLFKQVTLKLGDSGKTFVIRAPALSAESRYVQSATLNGRPWEQAWFRHADIVDGAELVLTMGPKPTAWGQTVRPPSLSKKP